MDLVIDEVVDKGLYYKKLSNDKVINITGEGGSGKSTIANGFRNDDNYIVVDYDLILLNPDVGTIEYELRQMLIKKYGNELFESINKVGIDKVKENFTIMYSEIINYLSSQNKTIVLDGTQLRFISDAKTIKGEFVALRPSLQTCVSQSVKRFIQNNPQVTAEQIQEYTQKRARILHQLNPMMNNLLTQVDVLPNIQDSEISFDNIEIQNYLLESARNFLNIIKDEYSAFMSPKQIQFLNQLLTTDCIEVNLNGEGYLQNQANEINNSSNMTSFEKLQELRKLNVPLAHGGRVFEDDKIHFYPSILLSENPNLSIDELKQKCDEVLIHELLSSLIGPKGLDVSKESINRIASDIQQKNMAYRSSIEIPEIEEIKKILDRISNNDDYKNPITSDEYLQTVNQDGYDIFVAHRKLEEILKEKFKQYTGRESQFQYDCLYEYAAYVIPMIKQDYASVLTPEAIARLDELTIKKKIKISKDSKRCSSHTDGQIEIPYIDESNPDFIKNVRCILDAMLHEIFHQTHRFRIGEDLLCRINGKEDLSGANYGGYLFEEGLTDKSTIDFARKHGLSCAPMFEYHIYTQLVDNVEKSLNCTNGDLFDENYQVILNKIDPTGQLLERYHFAELSRYTSTNFMRHNSDSQVEFDFKGKTYVAQKFPELSEKFKNQNTSVKNHESEKSSESSEKIGFDQRSQSEIRVAEQIRIKNQAIAHEKQKQSEKPKTLVKMNPNSSSSSNGYVNVVILSLGISFVAGMLTIIIYSILK